MSGTPTRLTTTAHGSPAPRRETAALDTLAWLEYAPAGALVPVDAVRDAIRALVPSGAAIGRQRPSLDSWRERLWSAPPETRIGVKELAAAVRHSPSWVWKRTAPKDGSEPLPHRKRDGELVFLVGEVRAWLEASETGTAPTSTSAAPSVVALHTRRRRPRP